MGATKVIGKKKPKAGKKTKIRDIMTKEVITIGTQKSAVDAATMMDQNGVGSLMILEKDSPVGMMTERDLVRRVIARMKDPETTKVSEIMSQPLVIVEPEGDIEAAAKIMAINEVRRLAVVESSKLVGIVTATDLAMNLAGQLSGYDAITRAIARYHKYGYRAELSL